MRDVFNEAAARAVFIGSDPIGGIDCRERWSLRDLTSDMVQADSVFVIHEGATTLT